MQQGYRFDPRARDEWPAWLWILIILGLLLIIGLFVVAIIALIRVSFTVDTTACGGNENTCIVPYKDYLGNCVEGRFTPNGKPCADSCYVGGSGVCTNGVCVGECPGVCTFGIFGGGSTNQSSNLAVDPEDIIFCPDLMINDPLFNESYPATNYCEMGGVCTYLAVHPDWWFGNQLWLSTTPRSILIDKCADLVSNDTFVADGCLVTDIYIIPITQPMTGSCDAEECAYESVEPNPFTTEQLLPYCFWTFGCAKHEYVPGSFMFSNQGTIGNGGNGGGVIQNGVNLSDGLKEAMKRAKDIAFSVHPVQQQQQQQQQK